MGFERFNCCGPENDVGTPYFRSKFPMIPLRIHMVDDVDGYHVSYPHRRWVSIIENYPTTILDPPLFFGFNPKTNKREREREREG